MPTLVGIYMPHRISTILIITSCVYSLCSNKKSGIYIIYIGSRQAIYNNIAALTKFFSSSVESLGRHAVPSGLRPSGTACRPWDSTSDEKTLVSGLYCCIQPSETQYIHYIYIYIYNIMYMWGLGGLYPTIQPSEAEVFYVRGLIPRAAARGHGVPPEGFD